MIAEVCAGCARVLDMNLLARCDVCEGLLYCLPCARGHLCFANCRERGCRAGGCLRLVRSGVTANRYGIPRDI